MDEAINYIQPIYHSLESDVFAIGGTSGVPSNSYVAEDGSTLYVAEDGATIYVQET